MNNVIITTTLDGKQKKEAFKSIRVLCEAKGWKYNSLKNKSIPTIFRGYSIERIPIKR